MDTPAGIVAALNADPSFHPQPSPTSHRPSASYTNIPVTNVAPSNPASTRKYAAFRLQSLISDPAFADQFVSLGGLVHLRRLVVTESGNTLSYGLSALSRLVDLDVGIDSSALGVEVIERAVAIVSEEKLVNILRGGLSLLVAVVGTGSRGNGPSDQAPTPTSSRPINGYTTVHSALPKHASFFTSLASHLGSADHGLGTSALQLINGLVRGALSASSHAANSTPVTSDFPSVPLPGSIGDWNSLMKQLQDVGVIRAVYGLARQGQNDGDLGSSLSEFESLTKRMLGRWRGMRVNDKLHDHLRALGVVYLAGNKKITSRGGSVTGTAAGTAAGTPTAESTATSAGWRRIGFLSGSGAAECASHPSGFLGLMDLADFVRRHAEPYSRYLNEQTFQPENRRCPFGRASLAVTDLLFQHFCLDDSEGGSQNGDGQDNTCIGGAGGESAARPPPPLNPLVLHWSRLHTATLRAFLRLWKETDAEVGEGPLENADFERVKGLVKVLIPEVADPKKPEVLSAAEQAKAKARLKNLSHHSIAGVGSISAGTGITKPTGPGDISTLETDMATVSLARLRAKQVETLDSQMAAQWASRLAPVRRELENEALQFVREQRIRCLLAGGWFEEQKPPALPIPVSVPINHADASQALGQLQQKSQGPGTLKYARLATDRRFLHWGEFSATSDDAQGKKPISASLLPNMLDLGAVSAVVSNTSATENGMKTVIFIKGDSTQSGSDRSSVTSKHTATTGNAGNVNATTAAAKDTLLTLNPCTPLEASEWLDGLLMVLNQQPITAATANLVGLLVDTGLRVRLLNVPLEEHDDEYAGVGNGHSPGYGNGYDESDTITINGNRRPHERRAGNGIDYDDDYEDDYDEDGYDDNDYQQGQYDEEDEIMAAIIPDTPTADAAANDGRPLRAHPVKRMGTGRYVHGGSMRVPGKKVGAGAGRANRITNGGVDPNSEVLPPLMGANKQSGGGGTGAAGAAAGKGLRPMVWPSRKGTTDPYWYVIGEA